LSSPSSSGKLALAAYANANEDDPNVEYQDGNVEINYVALLSARGMLMLMDEPVEDLTIEEAKEKMTGVDDAKEKNSAKEKEGDVENLPVVAQVKILNNLEHMLDVIMTKQDDDENKAESKANKAESEEKMTVTGTSTVVGVFEGWLHGDPHDKDLRWRFCQCSSCMGVSLSSRRRKVSLTNIKCCLLTSIITLR
jgi:hypothetical protein